MTMIKKVAKAIEDKRLELLAKPLARTYNDLAKVAIQAMREPTEEMIGAANRNNHPRDIDTWQTMIDAALKE